MPGDKQAMRRRLRDQGFHGDDRAVCARILEDPWFAGAKTVMAFMAMPSEPDLDPVIREILKQGKRLVLPRCEEGFRLSARIVADPEGLIPGVFGKAIANLGSMTGPLSMILIGATLAHMDFRKLLDPSVLLITALRLILFPLLFAVLLKFLHAEEMVMNICVILLAMPVASNTAAMAERYGGDHVFASACVSVSTLLSVITVPFITWLIQLIQ